MKFILIGLMALSLCGCATFGEFTKAAPVVAKVNQAIAAKAPDIASDCQDLQDITVELAKDIGNNKYVAAANGAITSYCAKVPTNIISTGIALAKAYYNAKAAYTKAK